MGHTRPVEKDAHYPGQRPVTPLPGRSATGTRMGLALACAGLLAACASAPPARTPVAGIGEPSASPAALRANEVLMRALGLVGTPYRYGGNTPDGGFDCSGLVGFVFRDAAGLALPRSTREIARVRTAEPKRERLTPGDLVLFGRREVDHIGIYVGEGRFVHAPSSGGTVRIDRLDGPYWRDRYVGAKRLLD